MIDVSSVYKTFYSRHKVAALVDVSLQVDKGEVVVICGPSGSGKSTLLRCLNHLETIDKGNIIIDGTTYTVKAGEIILMPGGIPHAVKAATPFKMLLTLFKSGDK